MSAKIIYPGTFDPITNGHVDIIKRALNLFDGVIVAVSAVTSAQKKGNNFDFTERFALVQNVLRQIPKIEVCQFSGLLVDLAREKNVFSVLRGLRAISDFEYELMLADMNRRLEPKIETIFLTPTEHYAYLTASMVREIASLGGDVSRFVPLEVCEALKEKNKH